MTKPGMWVIIKTSHPKQGVAFKVFGQWKGGYLDGDSWRLNSGIKDVVETDEFFEFLGYSGSVYKCHKSSYGICGVYHQGVINSLIERAETAGGSIEIMQDGMNWKELIKTTTATVK